MYFLNKIFTFQNLYKIIRDINFVVIYKKLNKYKQNSKDIFMCKWMCFK